MLEISLGIVGNLGLNLLMVNQFEVGVEWYYDSVLLVFFILFKKDISDFIFIKIVVKEINGQ